MINEKYIKVVDAQQYDSGDIEFAGKLKDLIEVLQEVYNTIPEHCRDKATYEIDSYDNYESSTATFKIGYYRDKTLDELAAEQEKVAYAQALQDAKEREIFDRLKAKFGEK